MPRSRLNSYLRTRRMAAALTQAEFGELIGASKQAVGKYELGHRPVSAKLLIASEIIFGVSAAELFPALYDAVEEEVAINALRLHTRLQSREDPGFRKKRALVEGIPKRLSPITEV